MKVILIIEESGSLLNIYGGLVILGKYFKV